MNHFLRSWPLLLLLLPAVAGCGVRSSPTLPAVVASAASTPSPPPKPADPPRLPPMVEENQTFVTVNGIPQYKIGPGDVLDVLLTKELAQERLSVTVRATGKVTIGFFEVTVGGLTPERAAEEIRQILAPSYKQLAVEVMVKEYESKAVSVLGEVTGKGGRFPLKRKTGLLDLLAQAGGPTQEADLRKVRLLRQDGHSYTISLFRLLSDGDRFRDVTLDAGDVVYVPARGPDEENQVFVLGEVKNPGAYRFRPNMRLSQALALAGGIKNSAALSSARVIRADLSNPAADLSNLQALEVDFESVINGRDHTQDLPLHTNDVVVVPRNAIGNWNAFLAQLKPTLQFLTLPLQPFTQYLLLQKLLED
ncbi:MAG: SLBB domain-containing protein [Candidatus Methylomirabilia bacterium]